MMLKDLRQSRIDLTITNQPGVLRGLSYAIGRDHRKIVVVDNTLYLGGLNLSQSVFERADFMAKINDRDIVEVFKYVFNQSEQTSRKDDWEIYCGYDNTRVLVDSGNGGSLILETAINEINNARKSIDLMTIGHISGGMDLAINNAIERGVKVRGFLSPRGSLGRALFPSPKRMVIYQPRQGISHAKLLIIDEQIAILGSHNFDQRLVWARTEEASLLTSRTHIVKPLVDFFEKTIAGGVRVQRKDT